MYWCNWSAHSRTSYSWLCVQLEWPSIRQYRLMEASSASVWSWPRLISRCSASAAASSPSSSSSSASTSTGRRKRPETQRTRNFRFQKTFPGLRRGRCSENFRQKRFFKRISFLYGLLFQDSNPGRVDAKRKLFLCALLSLYWICHCSFIITN